MQKQVYFSMKLIAWPVWPLGKLIAYCQNLFLVDLCNRLTQIWPLIMWVSIGLYLKRALYFYIRVGWNWAQLTFFFSLSHSKQQFIPIIGLHHPDSWLSNLHKYLPETLIRIQNNHSWWVRERIDLARDLQMYLRHDEESHYILSLLSLVSWFLNLFFISSPAGSRYSLFGFLTFFVVNSSFFKFCVSIVILPFTY